MIRKFFAARPHAKCGTLKTTSRLANALFESLETRQLLTAVVPAFADKIGLTTLINPTPTFVDEFDGTSLDTTKWNVREAPRWRPTPTSPDFAWTTQDSVSVANGALTLTAHTDPATGQYRSGWIQTANGADSLVPGSSANFLQQYGYWESRIKFSAMTGMWGAFWVHSPKMTSVGDDPAKANHPDVYGTEMDVVENAAVLYGGDSTNIAHTTTHANGYGANAISTSSHTDVTSLPGNTSPASYHVYGLMWTPTTVSVYIDGNLSYKETNPNMVSKIAQFVILSNEVGSPSSNTIGQGHTTWGLPPAGGFGTLDTSNAKMTVDYVHVWSLAGVDDTTPIVTPPPPPPAPPVIVPTPSLPPRSGGTGPARGPVRPIAISGGVRFNPVQPDSIQSDTSDAILTDISESRGRSTRPSLIS